MNAYNPDLMNAKTVAKITGRSEAQVYKELRKGEKCKYGHKKGSKGTAPRYLIKTYDLKAKLKQQKEEIELAIKKVEAYERGQYRVS